MPTSILYPNLHTHISPVPQPSHPYQSCTFHACHCWGRVTSNLQSFCGYINTVTELQPTPCIKPVISFVFTQAPLHIKPARSLVVTLTEQYLTIHIKRSAIAFVITLTEQKPTLRIKPAMLLWLHWVTEQHPTLPIKPASLFVITLSLVTEV